MQSLLTILVAFFLSSSTYAHEINLNKDWQYQVQIDSNNIHSDLKILSELEMDIAGVNIPEKRVSVLVDKFGYETLIEKGYSIRLTEIKGVTRGPDLNYKSPEEIESILHEIANQYPGITKIESIGKSLEGRDIWALKISDNASENEKLSEPVVLFNSMHHAREVMTPEVALDIIEQLTKNYQSNEKITNWVNSLEIWVVPMFNVDGNNQIWNGDMWWRKNTRNGYGVDLNRNYPAGWNSCNGSSGRTSAQNYRGESPASEPETNAMMNFVTKIRPVFDISYHSFSQLVIYPYGCEPRRTETSNVVELIGRHIASLIGYSPGTAWELLYNADGGDIDWMYDEWQVIPYVIELNKDTEGFHPEYNKWRNKTVERNRAGWQYLLDRALIGGLKGRVSVGNSKNIPTHLRIYRKKDGEFIFFQNYKLKEDGLFHLVLNATDYKIQIMNNDNVINETIQTIGDELVQVNFSI